NERRPKRVPPARQIKQVAVARLRRYCTNPNCRMATDPKIAPTSLSCNLLEFLVYKFAGEAAKEKRRTVIAKWQTNSARFCQHTFDFHHGNKSLESVV